MTGTCCRREGLNRGPEDRGPGTEDRGPGTEDRGPGTEDRGPGTEDQDPGLDPFFCMGGCGTHIEITSVKHQDFAEYIGAATILE